MRDKEDSPIVLGLLLRGRKLAMQTVGDEKPQASSNEVRAYPIRRPAGNADGDAFLTLPSQSGSDRFRRPGQLNKRRNYRPLNAPSAPQR